MTITEYKRRVIELFKSGRATEEQWQEMANAVMCASEDYYEAVPEIDATVQPETEQA